MYIVLLFDIVASGQEISGSVSTNVVVDDASDCFVVVCCCIFDRRSRNLGREVSGAGLITC